MDTLTKKQKEVLDFSSNYLNRHGIFPTIDEMRKELKLKAVSTVHEHMKTLERKGYLIKEGGLTKLVSFGSGHVYQIPVLGMIAAGEPIEAIENNDDTVTFSNNDIKSTDGYYALRVKGDSMIDEGIFDNDVVIIKKQSSAENGQTVVAIIDDNQATLKKLYRENNQFKLVPKNQNLLPFFRDEVEVRGVVVQVIRNIETENQTIQLNKTTGGLRTIDLFAGVGGIRIGFETAGFETVFANDFEANCKHTYDLNFPNSKLVVEDIRNIAIDDLPEFDFLLGGFPCQPFSIAGHRQGFEDQKNRGNLFFDIARIIEVRQPKGFLLENVKNLKTHDGGNTFKIIEQTLSKLGYSLKAKVLNTMEYGNVPQNRERIYIVGFKNPLHAERFNFPAPQVLSKKISDMLESDVPQKYYYNGKPLFDKLKDSVTEEGKVYQWRRQYVRENKSGVCPTLTANMGTGGHNVPIIKDKKGIRKLTPRECANIQGFPENYKIPSLADSALYKQFGNSVSVPVITRIANNMKQAII
jgi:DNA (cytosine-5)-methyltransferase 1